MNCVLCNEEIFNNYSLSKHVNKCHNLSYEKYIILTKYGNEPPLCKCGCGKPTKFRKGSFYGFPNFLKGHKDKDVKNKIEKKRRETCLKKYGTVCSLQSEQVKEKTVKTNLKKYGVKHYSQTDQYKTDLKKFVLEKYGTEWYTQSQDYKEKHLKKLSLSWSDILNHCDKKGYKPCFSYEDYENNRTVLKFLCKTHNYTFRSNLCNIQRNTGIQCPKCQNCGISSQEKEVAFFISENLYEDLDRNNRKIIPPWELDIYIPDKKIAIEYDGLYWHSEARKSEDYHFNKFKLCEEKGIRLFQIYEDEWRDKRDIWESILYNAFGVSQKFKKLNARDLIIDDNPSVKSLRKFLESNHLQGYARSKKKFVLKTKEREIVFCITLREPFTKNKENTIEIARVCSKKFCLVRGGFSRLMKKVFEWSKHNGYNTILTYSDCRYSVGEMYKNSGFEFVGHTGIGYAYTDFEQRFNRFKFRAQKPKTEKQIAEENDVCKIYNPGNYIWKQSVN